MSLTCTIGWEGGRRFLQQHKISGNPSMSYCSKYPFKVVGEITIWQSHSPEQVKTTKDGLAKLKEQGIEAIED